MTGQNKRQWKKEGITNEGRFYSAENIDINGFYLHYPDCSNSGSKLYCKQKKYY